MEWLIFNAVLFFWLSPNFFSPSDFVSVSFQGSLNLAQYLIYQVGRSFKSLIWFTFSCSELYGHSVAQDTHCIWCVGCIRDHGRKGVLISNFILTWFGKGESSCRVDVSVEVDLNQSQNGRNPVLLHPLDKDRKDIFSVPEVTSMKITHNFKWLNNCLWISVIHSKLFLIDGEYCFYGFLYYKISLRLLKTHLIFYLTLFFHYLCQFMYVCLMARMSLPAVPLYLTSRYPWLSRNNIGEALIGLSLVETLIVAYVIQMAYGSFNQFTIDRNLDCFSFTINIYVSIKTLF